MTHISKIRIDGALQQKLQERLFEILTTKQRGRERLPLFELLTQTEILMLAKRLAVVFMLSEGTSYYMIGKTLRVSISTVMRLQEDVQRGKYKTIIKLLNNKKKREGFWNLLEIILRAGMPPIAGKGRWSFLD